MQCLVWYPHFVNQLYMMGIQHFHLVDTQHLLQPEDNNCLQVGTLHLEDILHFDKVDIHLIGLEGDILVLQHMEGTQVEDIVEYESDRASSVDS